MKFFNKSSIDFYILDKNDVYRNERLDSQDVVNLAFTPTYNIL